MNCQNDNHTITTPDLLIKFFELNTKFPRHPENFRIAMYCDSAHDTGKFTLVSKCTSKQPVRVICGRIPGSAYRMRQIAMAVCASLVCTERQCIIE